MTSLHTPPISLTDLLQRVGDVPLERIVHDPAPGTATAIDALRLCDGEPKRLCELVDGVLVEKSMGRRESLIGARLIFLIQSYLQENNLGEITGADGPYQLLEDQVRFPDVAFLSWDRLPPDADPRSPMTAAAPNLAVEVLSPSNTRKEMQRKLEDYFAAGVELVWYIDPDDCTIDVFTAVDQKQTLREDDMLTGGTVLPGFQIAIKEIFESGERRRPKK